MKSLILIIFTIVMCSCNTIKHIDKTKIETTTTTEVTTATTKTITETAKEDVVIKGDSITGESDDLETDPIIEENGNIKITVTKDKKTGKIKAKAIQKERIVPIEIKRTTVEKVVENKHIKTHEVTKEKEKQVERTGGFNLNYLWWLLLLLLIPIWRYRRQLFGTNHDPGS